MKKRRGYDGKGRNVALEEGMIWNRETNVRTSGAAVVRAVMLKVNKIVVRPVSCIIKLVVCILLLFFSRQNLL